MSNSKSKSKTEFIKFVMSTIEHDCNDTDRSMEYLSSQGLNVERVISEGLKNVNLLKLKIEAERTLKEMEASPLLKKKAEDYVQQLLNSVGFSLQSIIQKESLSMSFRNVESLSMGDIKNILIKHFTLKFMEEQANNSDGI